MKWRRVGNPKRHRVGGGRGNEQGLQEGRPGKEVVSYFFRKDVSYSPPSGREIHGVRSEKEFYSEVDKYQ